MSTITTNRIAVLREFLAENQLQAFIIPSSDAHLSEYPSEHWKSREWISGFTGSAGTIVVTEKKAGLWTDSRYFLQAEKELHGSSIELFKDKLPETPTIAEWLLSELSEGQSVGVDGNVFSAKETNYLSAKLSSNGLKIRSELDPFETIWQDRPEIPLNPVYEFPVELSGISTSDKIKTICAQLANLGADGLIISSLDTIAWLFNLRGNDVEYNPVFVSYAYVSAKETVLFISPKKIEANIASNLQKEGIILAHYDKIGNYIKHIEGKKICVQSDKISFSLYKQAEKNNQIIDTISPADLLKSTKNETEIEGFRRAMLKDGVALVRFFRWLETAVPTNTVTEHLISEKLVEFRSEQDRFVGESFGTIAGFKENGAIVHYHADETASKLITNDGFLLIDSGAQYFDGTTDITRTILLGNASQEMKIDYTNVLKGHIALASAVFPDGTRGSQLDILTRQFLWKSGANYLHGTGHGIGHFLNVHEGPQSIRMEENAVTLKSGMVISNEPGIYKTGKHGVRTENLVLVTEMFQTEFGKFLHFETLTLCPIDMSPVVLNMLSPDEIDWINNYHAHVFNLLSPSLTADEKEWLQDKTKAI